MGSLWNSLLTQSVITRGWHLARADVRQDFAEDLLSTDVFASDLKGNVNEILHRIRTRTHQPRPLFRIEVPKGQLGFRPGTVIPIQDRTVVSAIALLIAEKLDPKLPATVYSWRLKSPIPKKGSIFGEGDVTDLPFLKSSTIRKKVDVFEGWYVRWPQFDRETRAVFQDAGYRFMATSDISAYFENIQLPILRDHLLRHLPDDSDIVNLLCSYLESWCERTVDGRTHHRGIPQGNFVSSFLGSFFLLPLDELFESLQEDMDVRYFRYMDDVRIFSKDRESARRAIFSLARCLQGLHLNVQSAKTRIYDESAREITSHLTDSRIDDLSSIIEATQGKRKTMDETQVRSVLKQLNDVARRKPADGQPIHSSKASLEGLAMRAFLRWMTAHQLVDSDEYVGRLLRELSKSSDAKLTRKLVSTSRQFPKKRSIESSIMRLLHEGKILHPHQHAESLRALRYLSSLDSSTVSHCLELIQTDSEDRYLRMQASYLLWRVELQSSDLRKVEKQFLAEPDFYVQAAMTGLLAQRRENSHEVVRLLVFHPNEKIRDIGRIFRSVRNDVTVAKDTLRHIFRSEASWGLCDSMPYVHLMGLSRNREILENLIRALKPLRRSHPIVGLRPVLDGIYARASRSLSDSQQIDIHSEP